MRGTTAGFSDVPRFVVLRAHQQIGNSLFDPKGADIVEGLLAKAKDKGVQIHLPTDYVTGDAWGDDANVRCIARCCCIARRVNVMLRWEALPMRAAFRRDGKATTAAQRA